MDDDLALALTSAGPAEAARLLSALFMAADQPFFYADLCSGALTCSRGIEVALGYPPSAVGRWFAEWHPRIHPEDARRVLKGFLSLERGTEVMREQLRVARADGAYATVRVRGSVLWDADRVVAIIGALTVEEHDDRALLLEQMDELRSRATYADLQERRRQLVTHVVSDLVYEWDISANTVTRSNKVERLLGYPAAAANSADWWLENIHGDDRPGVARSFRAFLDGAGRDRWVSSYRFRHADGRYVRVRDQAYAIRDGSSLWVIGAMAVQENEPSAPGPVVSLTPRQSEVLDLVRRGESNREIAARLHMSEQSAKEHVSRLLRAFGVRNRAALVAASLQARTEVRR